MKDKVYMHAVSNNSFDFDEQLSVLFDVLDTGRLLSLRKQGIDEPRGYAGVDYISLCDYEKRNMHPLGHERYNSYYQYIRYGISLAFDKKGIEVINPTIVKMYDDIMMNYYKMMEYAKKEGRYSDYVDEVQVKDELSLDNLVYLTFPTETFIDNSCITKKSDQFYELKKRVNEIKKYLRYYDQSVSVYDIDSQILLDDRGMMKLIYRR